MDADVEQKITTIFNEYLSNLDMKEASNSFLSLKLPQHYHKIVELGVSLTLEKTNEDRESISNLFTNLSTESLLKDEHFVKGFKSIFEQMEELEIDIPFVAKLIGDFLELAIKSKCFSISLLDSIPEKVKASMKEII